MSKPTQKKLSEKYLKEQRNKLKDYQRKLESELSRISKKRKGGYHPSFPQYGSKEEDNILEMEDFAENLSIEDKLNQLLKDTKSAIKGINKGSYGTCQSCGQPIQKERLKVFPLASECISCAKNKSKGFWGRIWPFNK